MAGWDPLLDRHVGEQGAAALLLTSHLALAVEPFSRRLGFSANSYGVGLARVLLSEPNVMLLDSPFSVLHGQQADQLVAHLLRRRGHGTTLLVADDPRLVALADQVIVMRDGAAVFSGSPSDLVSRQGSPP